MPTLVIQGTVINLSDSGGDPNWAPGVIAFAEAVTTALEGVAGDFDVSPQVFSLNSYDISSNTNIPLLSFPVSNVLSVQITYSLTRTSSATTVADGGTLSIVYKSTNPSGNKWNIVRHGNVDGGANITFNVTDAGVVQFSTTTIGGISHTGVLAYSGKALTLS